MTPLPTHHPLQAGSSLIEVLVAILLLSFGILSLSTMLSFAVQMPKLSGYRSVAVNLASSYVERIRANSGGFSNASYDNLSSYDGSQTKLALNPDKLCDYPACSGATLATMDFEQMKVAVRAELPAGGIFMARDGAIDGNLWIVWLEPSTLGALNPSSSDNCPSQVTDTYTDPSPRCLYVRFKL